MASNERVVLITGASSGIGLATAQLLARSHTRLFLVGRDLAKLQAVAQRLPAMLLPADVSDAGAVQRLAVAIEQNTGRLDVLVNCAGQLEVGPADHLGVEVAERLMQVNFLGAVRMIHACLPLLRRGEQPVIVNVSSLAGRIVPPFMAAYAASKFALGGYSHALRQELGPEGIHVGLVLPGPVDTPMVDGKLGGIYYPVPKGTPVITPGHVARAIAVLIERRLPEIVVPRWLAPAARLGSAFPGLVDHLYARKRRPRQQDRVLKYPE